MKNLQFTIKVGRIVSPIRVRGEDTVKRRNAVKSAQYNRQSAAREIRIQLMEAV
jgi:hypothetical protein